MDSPLQHLRISAVLSFVLLSKYLLPRPHCWAVAIGALELMTVSD